MLGVNIQLLLKDNLIFLKKSSQNYRLFKKKIDIYNIRKNKISKEIMKTLNMTYGMHPVCGMVHMFPCGGGRPMSILECLKFSCMLQS